MTGKIIIVGIDHSEQSRAALEWAADYARCTGAKLRAISVHPHWHAALPYAVGVAGLPLIEQESWDDQDRLAMTDLFRSVHPEPGWELAQTTGDPGPELVRAADRAGLLVVGTREHRGFERFLEGSVSHYCLRHSDIPVVAVPVPTSVVRATEPTLADVGAVAEDVNVERTVIAADSEA